MSEFTGGKPPQPGYVSVVHPSAENLPAFMLEGYAQVNAGIHAERRAFGTTLQAPHLRRSQQDIAETAGEALRRTGSGDERSAIVLGAGGCADIPLERLATDFDSVTVVDLDTSQTERALSNISGPLLGKITLMKADISGLAAGFARLFQEAGEAPDLDGFSRKAARLATAMNAEAAAARFGDDYAFVCSQLVMSQLVSLPVLEVNERAKERYGQSLRLTPAGPHSELFAALNGVNRDAQMAHARQLRSLVRHNGTVHFADTIGQFHMGRLIPMLLGDAMDALQADFAELHPINQWPYTASPYTKFMVISTALTSNPHKV